MANRPFTVETPFMCSTGPCVSKVTQKFSFVEFYFLQINMLSTLALKSCPEEESRVLGKCSIIRIYIL